MGHLSSHIIVGVSAVPSAQADTTPNIVKLNDPKRRNVKKQSRAEDSGFWRVHEPRLHRIGRGSPRALRPGIKHSGRKSSRSRMVLGSCGGLRPISVPKPSRPSTRCVLLVRSRVWGLRMRVRWRAPASFLLGFYSGEIRSPGSCQQFGV